MRLFAALFGWVSAVTMVYTPYITWSIETRPESGAPSTTSVVVVAIVVSLTCGVLSYVLWVFAREDEAPTDSQPSSRV